MNTADISSLLSRLRPRDREELVEYGFDHASALAAFAAPAVLSRVFSARASPQAFIAFHALTPRALVVSMVAAPEWRSVLRDVWRWSQREAKPQLLRLGYHRAECRTMQGHEDAIRFLEHLGFRQECPIPDFGASGAAFIQYAWRLENHVPHQDTQGATRAATPATP